MERIVREGMLVRLRIAEERDLEFILESEAEPENARYIIADSRSYHKDTLDSPAAAHFIVERKDTGEAVGFLIATGRNSPHHEQYWRRVIINERGKGYGKQAMQAIMKWCFEDLKLERLYLDHYTGNPAAGLYLSLGFQYEGVLRRNCRKNGKLYDVHLMSMLKEEYEALQR